MVLIITSSIVGNINGRSVKISGGRIVLLTSGNTVISSNTLERCGKVVNLIKCIIGRGTL